jgi:YD repeat-containing protein
MMTFADRGFWRAVACICDPAGQRTGQLYSDGNVATFTYDPVGNLEATEDWTGFTSNVFGSGGTS